MSDDGRAQRVLLVTQIRDALAQAEGELGIQVTVEADVVTLRGVVQNEERRVRLGALSRAVSRGFSVANEITVCTPDSPTPAEQLP
jgi:osmotically-inducible protein OsmY